MIEKSLDYAILRNEDLPPGRAIDPVARDFVTGSNSEQKIYMIPFPKEQIFKLRYVKCATEKNRIDFLLRDSIYGILCAIRKMQITK